VAAKRSRNRLNGKITRISPGVAIYKVHASPYWQARIWDLRASRYVVRSTKETAKLEARKVAVELAYEFRGPDRPAAREFSFKYYATRLVANARRLVESGERKPDFVRNSCLFLDNDTWGLVRHFGPRDVRELKTRDFQLFIQAVTRRRPELATSTLGSLMATFRNVMKVARDDGVIDSIPATPRVRQRDNPRPFFQFAPLVTTERDEWDKLKRGAKQLAATATVIRGVTVTHELYDLLLFCVHSFVRPTTTELYALKHSDVSIALDPPRLVLTIRNGKTGFRVANTMPGAVPVYKRIQERYPAAQDEDYLFLPGYPNRQTAARIFQRQFNHLLADTGLRRDVKTGKDRTLYSLRHTAICMRIVLSGGRINDGVLAENAGTSTDQIERFYKKYLGLPKELIQNLQSFAE